MTDSKQDENEFELAGRSTYLRIDLDAILHNVRILRSLCSPDTGIIGVIKANAYGHGSVEVARHLEANGVTHFGVGTAGEGIVLRKANITASIQCFGNAVKEDISQELEHNITPTVATAEFLDAWAQANSQRDRNKNSTICQPVILKVDTGMSRNGCQPEELQTLLEVCYKKNIPVHSVMTHFSQSWDNEEFTKTQLNRFLKVTKGLRDKGIKLHVANSAAVINGYGTNLDFVRPGICMYGLPPDTSETSVSRVRALGLRPALSWLAHPTLLKTLQPNRYVGYDKSYRCTSEETIATFGLGYADGFRRSLAGKASLTSTEGTPHPVIGRISMDTITVKIDKNLLPTSVLHVLTNDYDSCNSVVHVAAQLGTIPYELLTSLAVRLPRLYTAGGSVKSTVR